MQRVADQVLQHPLDEADVGGNQRDLFGAFEVEGDTLLFRLETESLNHILDQLGEGEGLELGLHVP